MPQMANITVKKADGTTDQLYTAATGSAGDKSPAVWYNKSVGTTAGEWPEFTLLSEPTATKTARRFVPTFSWPMTEQDAGGNVRIIPGAKMTPTGVIIPRNMSPLVAAEFVHQGTALMASALVRQSLIDGFAPR